MQPAPDESGRLRQRQRLWLKGPHPRGNQNRPRPMPLRLRLQTKYARTPFPADLLHSFAQSDNRLVLFRLKDQLLR